MRPTRDNKRRPPFLPHPTPTRNTFHLRRTIRSIRRTTQASTPVLPPTKATLPPQPIPLPTTISKYPIHFLLQYYNQRGYSKHYPSKRYFHTNLGQRRPNVSRFLSTAPSTRYKEYQATEGIRDHSDYPPPIPQYSRIPYEQRSTIHRQSFSHHGSYLW